MNGGKRQTVHFPRRFYFEGSSREEGTTGARRFHQESPDSKIHALRGYAAALILALSAFSFQLSAQTSCPSPYTELIAQTHYSPDNRLVYLCYNPANGKVWANFGLINGTPGNLGSATDGQLLIGDTSAGTFDVASATAGTGISLTAGHGTLTIANTGLTGTCATVNALAKFIGSTTTACSTVIDNGSSPVKSPNGLDVSTAGAYSAEVANNATTGTTLNLLACDDGAGKAIVCPHATSTTNVPIGVVIAGAGTTGNAVIATLGFYQGTFSNASTALHWAIEDPTTDGEFQDSGSTTRPSGQSAYFIWVGNASPGLASIRTLTPEEINAANSGGGSNKIQFNGTAAQPTVNFNATTPAVDAGALALTFKASKSGNTTSAITELPGTAVTPGSYTNSSVTVDQQGRVTSASSGTAPVTAVTGTAPIASSGGSTPAISLNNSGVSPGSYTNSSITVDATGRVTAASNGSGSPNGTLTNLTFSTSSSTICNHTRFVQNQSAFGPVAAGHGFHIVATLKKETTNKTVEIDVTKGGGGHCIVAPNDGTGNTYVNDLTNAGASTTMTSPITGLTLEYLGFYRLELWVWVTSSSQADAAAVVDGLGTASSFTSSETNIDFTSGNFNVYVFVDNTSVDFGPAYIEVF